MNKKNRTGGVVKTPTGIAGFDHLTGGGLPAGRTTLVLGRPGSGKTVLALQTLVNGARQGEPGMFVSFNEFPPQLVENAGAFNWDVAALEKEKLVFMDARLKPAVVKAGEFDLNGLLAALQAVAAESGARRVVLDSFDVLFTLLDDGPAELQEIFRLRDWLFARQFTALVTANLDGADPRAAQRLAGVQLLADCVVTLDYRLTAQASVRQLRVTKYRGSSYAEAPVPFSIGESGIKVHNPLARGAAGAAAAAALGSEIESAKKELAARIEAPDNFLEVRQAERAFRMRKASASPSRAGKRRTAKPAQPGPANQEAPSAGQDSLL
jgi:circadian clock protein KaiC